MKWLALLLFIQISQGEHDYYDKRIITTLKYSKNPVKPTIVNGLISAIGNVPYFISIKQPISVRNHSKTYLYLPFCGGSIISSKSVLTAAHCFELNNFFYYKHPETVRLVAGNIQSNHYHTGDTVTNEYGQWRKINNLYLHEDFLFPHNDIALIYVDTDWKFTDDVNYVILATVDTDYDNCFSAGFGRTRHDQTKLYLTQVLLQAKIDVLSNCQCGALWEMDMSTFVCTDSEISDVANGDSGGPLGCKFTNDPAEEENRDLLIGVVCGKNFDRTSIFTRVSKYKDWIDAPTKLLVSGGYKLFCKFVVVCEHCQNPMSEHDRPAVVGGFSYHEKCRKCYVCSEKDLRGAEVFKGVIFCSSCSNRIFRGCSTVRHTKEMRRNRTKSIAKTKRRRSHRTKGKSAPRSPKTPGILALTELIASSGTSDQSDDTRVSQRSQFQAEIALTEPKPNYDAIYHTDTLKRKSAEIGMTTEVTQQLLNELNCPVVTRYDDGKNCAVVEPPPKPLRKKKSPCSDLRIAELGTSREIANMALRHKKELPVIIKSVHAKEMASTSESILNKESEDLDGIQGWTNSKFSTLDGSAKSQGKHRQLRTLLKAPFSAFQNKILRRSSLVTTESKNSKENESLMKKLKIILHEECCTHQKRGLKRLYSALNRKQRRHKLGWANLVTKVYGNFNDSRRLAKSTPDRKCKHFEESPSYRCMRAQAMRLAGPTKSELAMIRKKIKRVIAPSFMRYVTIPQCKRPAIMTSQGCGMSSASHPESSKVL